MNFAWRCYRCGSSVNNMAEVKPDYMLEQPMNVEVPKRENLQLRSISREVDLSWLAGIIDGEGNLDFSVNTRYSGKARVPNRYLQPKVRIANTDIRMIKKISEIYVAENLVFFYALNSVKRYKNRQPTWKNQLEITVCHQTSTSKLLRTVLPYLVSKAELARRMLVLIEWVQAQPHRGNNSIAGQNYCERPEFLALIERCKEERQFHIDPSTTIRQAREVLSW